MSATIPRVGLVMLLFVTAHATAEKQTSKAVRFTGRRAEVAEDLWLSENGRFRFAFSYGSLDMTAEGTWSARADTLLLTTATIPEPYSITTRTNDSIPKGKIALHFLHDRPNALKQRFRLDAAARLQGLDGALATADGYLLQIEHDRTRPVHLELHHGVFDYFRHPYARDLTLPKGHNEVRIAIDPSIRSLRFTDEAFLLTGRELKHLHEGTQSIFADVYTTEATDSQSAFLRSERPTSP